MYNKIVDAISVKAQIKPMGGGKVEQWWRENGLDENRSLNKTTNNRFLSGREKDSVLKPSVMETLQACNFKGFEFGNWLSQAERYDVFRAFQWCLQDMTNWLGTMNLGFDSCIGVAFGARGSRGARAHYEPATNIINMTKQKGAGSFLHEYAHAIDYCVGAFFDQCEKYTALSGGGRTMEQPSNNVGGQFRAMMNKILIYARNTESYNNMLKNPLVKVNIDYWGNSTEMFARLTEAYYAYFHNHRQNHYLVKRKEYYEGSDVYLTEEEIRKIKPEIDKFWKEVALLLNNKCKLKKTPFPTVKKKEPKVGKPKSEKLYDVVMDKYTDSTYTKIKRHGYGAVSKSSFRTLDSILKHFESIEGKRIGLKSLKFISRTKYSIRFKNNKGEYCESYIVDEEGKRLKESKTPKGKGMVQQPIQF